MCALPGHEPVGAGVGNAVGASVGGGEGGHTPPGAVACQALSHTAKTALGYNPPATGAASRKSESDELHVAFRGRGPANTVRSFVHLLRSSSLRSAVLRLGRLAANCSGVAYLTPHGHHGGLVDGGGGDSEAFAGSNQRGTQSQQLQSTPVLTQYADAPGLKEDNVVHGVGAGVGCRGSLHMVKLSVFGAPCE